MSNVCILALIGIPGTGKTHFCNLMKENSANNKFNAVHVSYDEYGKEIKDPTYKKFRGKLFEIVENLLNKLSSTSSETNLIIIDDNNYYSSMRRSYYNLAKKYKTGFCSVYLFCDIETAISRVSSRTDNKISEEIIREMSQKLEPPSSSIPWQKYSISINSESKYNLTDVFDLIKAAIIDPEKEEPTFVAPIESISVLQNADLIIRKIIHKRLETANSDEKNDLAKKLSLKKKDIMKNLRRNQFSFSAIEDSALEKNLTDLLEETVE